MAGHELVGTIIELGKGVRNWKPGQRVTMPFVAGCGHCEPCLTGNQQVCDHQFQPGFTHWGSFAQYVAIHYADMNLVHLPREWIRWPPPAWGAVSPRHSRFGSPG
jgi:alcohol dehydrogenase